MNLYGVDVGRDKTLYVEIKPYHFELQMMHVLEKL